MFFAVMVKSGPNNCYDKNQRGVEGLLKSRGVRYHLIGAWLFLGWSEEFCGLRSRRAAVSRDSWQECMRICFLCNCFLSVST